METPRRRIEDGAISFHPALSYKSDDRASGQTQRGATEEGRGQPWKWTLDRAETESGVARLTLSVTSLHCISIHPNPDYNI